MHILSAASARSISPHGARPRWLLALIAFAFLTTPPACDARADDKAKQPLAADVGQTPILVDPHKQFIPKVNLAKAVGWREGQKPLAADGFSLQPFATNLAHPRWLYVLPNGDVLVAETNAPERKGSPGIRRWFIKKAMAKAGAATPSADRISLLRDTDHDGVADTRYLFAGNLHSPFGMALVNGDLYVANTDAVDHFHYEAGATSVGQKVATVAALPAGQINHHWTKNILASADGRYLYATVGSNSNVGENGIAAEEQRACILQIDLQTRVTRVFASGLRNPNGLAWQPQTRELWTAVNERDEIGDLLVPDYITSVRDGGFYGWPYSYYGSHVDARVKPQRPDLVAQAIAPDLAVGAHTASLGLTFYTANTDAPNKFTEHYRGAFVGQHGSWNRTEFAGYKVVFIPFDANGRPLGTVEDFVTGFLNGRGEAMGRPVGVAVDKTGALLIADDVGNAIWRVAPIPSLAPKVANGS